MYSIFWPLRMGKQLFLGFCKEEYLHFLNLCFDYTSLLSVGSLRSRKSVEKHQLVVAVTLIGRHKSVHNRCVIENFSDVLCFRFSFLVFRSYSN